MKQSREVRPLSIAAALLVLGLVLVFGPAASRAQSANPSSLFNQPDQSLSGQSNAVEFLFPEQVTVRAGKPSPIEMHFRVAPGLHINSHAPHDPYLIPTTLNLPGSSGVQLLNATFPRGKDFTLPADPKTHLSVYTGEFTIRVRILAPRGNHLVQARLRYQACNDNQCLPPRTITVAIDIIAK